jgi:hypothetical protein
MPVWPYYSDDATGRNLQKLLPLGTIYKHISRGQRYEMDEGKKS